VSNILQDILVMFSDANTGAHAHACTHGRTGQKQYASGHTMLGRGI